VNKYTPPQGKEQPLPELRVIDNSAVREAQIAKLNQLRAERSPDAVEAALRALTTAATSGEGNLMALAIDAARARCTVGEISEALERPWGRYAPYITLPCSARRAQSPLMPLVFRIANTLADTRQRLAREGPRTWTSTARVLMRWRKLSVPLLRLSRTTGVALG
jgi:hypothetical protein